jgi:curved DNA-binding protein CbpA
LKDNNYYEILGIAPHVGSGQIQAAYRFARGLYSGDSTPTYGLLDAQERAQMLALVEEAYTALSNPNARRDYDAHLGQRGAKTIPSSESAGIAPRADPPDTRTLARPAPILTPPLESSVDPIRVPEVVTGSVLKALRESRKLSIDQIAALSKVGGRFLRALEEDRHDALPGRVFARGFLIEYARAIRVSESEIVERYLRQWPIK